MQKQLQVHTDKKCHALLVFIEEVSAVAPI